MMHCLKACLQFALVLIFIKANARSSDVPHDDDAAKLIDKNKESVLIWYNLLPGAEKESFQEMIETELKQRAEAIENDRKFSLETVPSFINDTDVGDMLTAATTVFSSLNNSSHKSEVDKLENSTHEDIRDLRDDNLIDQSGEKDKEEGAHNKESSQVTQDVEESYVLSDNGHTEGEIPINTTFDSEAVHSDDDLDHEGERDDEDALHSETEVGGDALDHKNEENDKYGLYSDNVSPSEEDIEDDVEYAMRERDMDVDDSEPGDDYDKANDDMDQEREVEEREPEENSLDSDNGDNLAREEDEIIDRKKRHTASRKKRDLKRRKSGRFNRKKGNWRKFFKRLHKKKRGQLRRRNKSRKLKRGNQVKRRQHVKKVRSKGLRRHNGQRNHPKRRHNRKRFHSKRSHWKKRNHKKRNSNSRYQK